MWFFFGCKPYEVGCILQLYWSQFLTLISVHLRSTLVFEERLKPKSPARKLWVQNREYEKIPPPFDSKINRNKYFYSLILRWLATHLKYLKIIPQAQIALKSIAHKAKARTGYWLRGHQSKRNNNNCFK